MIVYDSRGNKFTTQPLAGSGNSGNEGEVFAVVGNPDFVIKIFHKDNIAQVNNRTEERYNKLKAMLNNVPVDQTLNQYGYRSFTFPVDIVYDSTLQNKDTFLGYLMPKIPHDCKGFTYSIIADKSLREPAFENILIRTLAAQNLAGLIRHFHSKAYVIGDINRSNLFIGTGANTAGFVTLIDIDSMQVPNPNGGFYRSTVGFPDYTPPELQGINLRTIDRTTHHDNFILAIFIFQLLMDGFHPFQGGDHPNEVLNIKHNSSFINNIYPQKYPTGCPDFAILPPNIRTLFLKCFNHGFTDPSVRPTAKEWKRVLTNYSNSLRKCSQNGKHYYGEHLSQCPWCGSVPKKKVQQNQYPNQNISGTGQASVATSQVAASTAQSTLKTGTSSKAGSGNSKTQPTYQGSASNPTRLGFMLAGRRYLSRLNSKLPRYILIALIALIAPITPLLLPTTAGALAPYPFARTEVRVCPRYPNNSSQSFYYAKMPNILPNTFGITEQLGIGGVKGTNKYRFKKIAKQTWYGKTLYSGTFPPPDTGHAVIYSLKPSRWNQTDFYGVLFDKGGRYRGVFGVSRYKSGCEALLKRAEASKDDAIRYRLEYAKRYSALGSSEKININQVLNDETLGIGQAEAREISARVALEEAELASEQQRRTDYAEILAFKRDKERANPASFYLCIAYPSDNPSDYVHRRQYGSSDLPETDIFADTQYSTGVNLILRRKEIETISASEKYYKYVGKMYSSGSNAIDENLYVIYSRKDGVQRNIGISKNDNNVTQRYIAIARTKSSCTSDLTYAKNSYSTQLNAWARSATSKTQQSSTSSIATTPPVSNSVSIKTENNLAPVTTTKPTTEAVRTSTSRATTATTSDNTAFSPRKITSKERQIFEEYKDLSFLLRPPTEVCSTTTTPKEYTVKDAYGESYWEDTFIYMSRGDERRGTLSTYILEVIDYSDADKTKHYQLIGSRLDTENNLTQLMYVSFLDKWTTSYRRNTGIGKDINGNYTYYVFDSGVATCEGRLAEVIENKETLIAKAELLWSQDR